MRGAPLNGSDVVDLHDLDFFLAGRRAHPDDVAFVGAQQRPGDGRDPAHMALGEVDLLDADDLDGAFFALFGGAGHGGAEEHLVGPGPPGRVDDLRALEPLVEKADPRVDLAQPLLAVEIVAVLRAVAIGGGPRHDLHDLGPLLAHERHQLLAHALEALRGHVVLGAGGQTRDLVGQLVPAVPIVVAVAFLGEGLAHFGSCSIKAGPMTTSPTTRLQRASGESRVAFDLRDGRTRLGDLYQRDPCRVLFPQSEPGEPPQAVLLTTSGGVTEGDSLKMTVEIGPGAAAVATTQAAEKVYRAAKGGGHCAIDVAVRVAEDATLEWLPQETIVVEGSRRTRR